MNKFVEKLLPMWMLLALFNLSGCDSPFSVKTGQITDASIRVCPGATRQFVSGKKGGEIVPFCDLSFEGFDIDDMDFVRLFPVSGIKTLCLTGTHIGDQSIRELLQLTDLETLQIDNTKVTQASVSELTQMTWLKRLNISENRGVTLNRLVISQFSHLDCLIVSTFQLTPEAIEMVRDGRGGCDFVIRDMAVDQFWRKQGEK